jgi:hypothetical protein
VNFEYNYLLDKKPFPVKEFADLLDEWLVYLYVYDAHLKE